MFFLYHDGMQSPDSKAPLELQRSVIDFFLSGWYEWHESAGRLYLCLCVLLFLFSLVDPVRNMQ